MMTLHMFCPPDEVAESGDIICSTDTPWDGGAAEAVWHIETVPFGDAYCCPACRKVSADWEVPVVH